jgi:hypothetical protein
MKLFRYGLALALVTTLVAPALAKDYDICVDPIPNTGFVLDDLAPAGFSAGDGITAVGIIVPGGTIPTDGFGVASCSSIAGLRIGTFFVKGRIVAGLPQAAADDLAFIDWDFRIDGKGEFTTSGIVKNAAVLPPLATYPHIITGATGGVAPAKGKITVTILGAGGFQIRVSVPGNEGKGND